MNKVSTTKDNLYAHTVWAVFIGWRRIGAHLLKDSLHHMIWQTPSCRKSGVFQICLRCPSISLWAHSSQSEAGLFRRCGFRAFIQLCSVCIMFLKKVFEFLREHGCFENFTGCALLWSAYFGRLENIALESSDMTGWALTSAFRDSPTAPCNACVCVCVCVYVCVCVHT